MTARLPFGPSFRDPEAPVAAPPLAQVVTRAADQPAPICSQSAGAARLSGLGLAGLGWFQRPGAAFAQGGFAG